MTAFLAIFSRRARKRWLAQACHEAAARKRALPLSHFLARAAEVVDSDPVIRIYGATEWDELSEDGQAWVAAIVREALAQNLEESL